MQLLLIANLLLISIINGIFAMNFAVPMKPKSPSGFFANFYRLTVQIERLTENPIFAYLYWEEEWKWRSPVRYKLQLYPHWMHAEKLKGEILMSQNVGEFDEFTFEGLPLAWINKDDGKNSEGSNLPISDTDPETQRVLAAMTLELRVEIPAIKQVLFTLFQIKAFGNSRDYSYRFKYLLKPSLKQIPAAGSLPPLQMEMALLRLATEQRQFCEQTRQTSLPLLIEQANEGIGSFLGAQFYRDAQWLEYNVLLFQLEMMEKLEDMGAFENVEQVKAKIRDLRKELATLMVKLWIMQEDYIAIRGQIQADKAFAIKKLVEKGSEIDILLDEFVAKIEHLATMLQKENTAKSVKSKGKAPAEMSSPILPAGISAAVEGPKVTDFASNQVHHQQSGIRLFGQNLSQPSVQHEEIVVEDEDAENISPRVPRRRSPYHEIARFTDENAFKQWIQGKDWIKESSRGNRDPYFCKFRRRKGHSCKTRLQVIRDVNSNLIRVEENEVPHTHEPIVPLEGSHSHRTIEPEIVEEDEDNAENFSPRVPRRRPPYHEIARFTDENAFEQWIQEKDWTRDTSKGNLHTYFCKFYRRKGHLCKTRLRVIRDDDSNLIRVEENEVPHTHEPIVPLKRSHQRIETAAAGAGSSSSRPKKRLRSTSQPTGSEASQGSSGKSSSQKKGDESEKRKYVN